jgi:hypothetical protein
MKESVLKKEFKPRDVARLRNLISGKTGDATQLQAGWERNSVDHTEGDVWQEDGKKWTIKNGIKQTVTKLDDIKKLVVMPLTCPNCGKLMKVDFYNKKMWSIHQKCFDCVIKMESEIKREGKWKEYESGVMNENKNAMLTDLEMALENWVEEKDTFVSESGEVEKWGGGDKNAIYKQAKEEIVKLRKLDIYKGENL